MPDIPSPTDRSRFRLPEGFEQLDPGKHYRIYLRATYPEIEPQCLLVIRGRPRDLRERSWSAVRQRIDKCLRSVKFEVVMVKESESGKVVVEEYPSGTAPPTGVRRG